MAYQVQKKQQQQQQQLQVDEEEVQAEQHQVWADLPQELLDIIFQRLDLWDVCQCSRVCSRWGSIVLDTLTAPLLCFPTPRKYPRGRQLQQYADLITEPAYLNTESSGKAPYNVSIEIPTGFTQGISVSHRGWLLLSDLDLITEPSKLLFYCPISRATVKLPSLKRYHIPTLKYATSSARVDRPNCIVLACYATSLSSHEFAFWRSEGRRWKPIRARPEQTLVDDMIFYNRDFYAIDTRGVLLQFKLRLKFPRADELPTRTTEELPCMSGSIRISRYLVESSTGELVMVVRLATVSTRRTWSFRVFKMNWETGYWEIVRKFGKGETLFLGHCDSMFVSSNDYRSNCIYFFDDQMPSFYNSGNCDFGVYNMKDQTIEHVLPSKNLRTSIYCRWFFPCL